jgi:hypothetical protein
LGLGERLGRRHGRNGGGPLLQRRLAHGLGCFRQVQRLGSRTLGRGGRNLNRLWHVHRLPGGFNGR